MFLFQTGDFAIVNQYIGTITVAKLLNAEEQSIYNLTVMAEDDAGASNGGVSLNSTVSSNSFFSLPS